MTPFPPGSSARDDESPGADSAAPRLVTHLDDGATAAVGALCDELGLDGDVLDRMSLSHRCPTRAVRGWLAVREQDRPELVAEHHRQAGRSAEPVVQERVRGTWRAEPLWACWARRT